MKEKLGKRIFKNSLLFFLFIYSVELITRFNVGSNFIDWAILRIAFSSAIISIILGIIVSLFNNLWRNILMTIFSFLIMIYTWAEINLFNYMGFFMGIGNAEQGTKITEYIKDYIGASKFISYLVIIPFILLLTYIWFIQRKLKIRKLNKTIFFVFKKESSLSITLSLLYSLLAIIVLCLSYYLTLTLNFMQNNLQSVPNKELILTSDNSNLSVSQFGVLIYGSSDLILNLFNINTPEITYDMTENYNEAKETTDYSRKIDDTAWNSIINGESNETYNTLNNYFINRDITDKNEYTGIFKGKNLIVVLMESTNMIAINETEFPTLYKIYNEGISFTNNYSPRNNCSTGNNEMTVMTSLFTINNTCTANTYKNNKYYEAIFNMFDNEGYTTSSYHDYAEVYYARRTIHPNMGSMNYYNVNDLGISWSSVYEEWPSDVDLIETSTPHFINDEHFMVFLTSVTTHQPYTVSSEMGDKHLSEFSAYDYSTPVKRYMSKMKELDAALKDLLDKLEAAGKLDNTVIALFADHYPYGLTTSQISSVLDTDVTVNNEVDRTPMVIYNSTIEPQKVTKYTSIIDLLPTLLNMFDLNYDPRLYLGHDIFSNYSDRTVFADGSWQDSIGYYSSTTGAFSPIDPNKTYTDEELININNEITTRQKMSALAIKNNYFNYLNNALIKYKEEQATTTTTTTTNIQKEE
jgi:lipoteichoic acid synthase